MTRQYDYRHAPQGKLEAICHSEDCKLEMPSEEPSDYEIFEKGHSNVILARTYDLSFAQKLIYLLNA